MEWPSGSPVCALYFVTDETSFFWNFSKASGPIFFSSLKRKSGYQSHSTLPIYVWARDVNRYFIFTTAAI